jgi:hypothetical protein
MSVAEAGQAGDYPGGNHPAYQQGEVPAPGPASGLYLPCFPGHGMGMKGVTAGGCMDDYCEMKISPRYTGEHLTEEMVWIWNL